MNFFSLVLDALVALPSMYIIISKITAETRHLLRVAYVIIVATSWTRALLDASIYFNLDVFSIDINQHYLGAAFIAGVALLVFCDSTKRRYYLKHPHLTGGGEF